MLNLLKQIAANSTFGWKRSQANLRAVSFAGNSFYVNEQWVHEREYLDFIQHGSLTGPLAIDLWVFGTFVKRGDRILDAGANVGFTSLLATYAGADRVDAFEPDPRLQKQLALNTDRIDAIHVHAKALGRQLGTERLRLSESHNQGSTFSQTHLRLFPHVYEQSTTTVVDVETVDHAFLEDSFDILKIDVEGAEHDVLLGTEKHFADKSPRIVYVELYDEYLPPVEQFLSSRYRHGYRVVCRRDGSGRLFDKSVDLAPLEDDGCFVHPPSYIYLNDVEPYLLQGWTQPELLSNVRSRSLTGFEVALFGNPIRK